MTEHGQKRRNLKPGARTANVAAQPRSAEQVAQMQAHAVRVLMQTAVATAVIGVVFLLTSSHILHDMSVFLFAWSGGWAFASATIRIQRVVKRGRRSDER